MKPPTPVRFAGHVVIADGRILFSALRNRRLLRRLNGRPWRFPSPLTSPRCLALVSSPRRPGLFIGASALALKCGHADGAGSEPPSRLKQLGYRRTGGGVPCGHLAARRRTLTWPERHTMTPSYPVWAARIGLPLFHYQTRNLIGQMPPAQTLAFLSMTPQIVGVGSVPHVAANLESPRLLGRTRPTSSVCRPRSESPRIISRVQAQERKDVGSVAATKQCGSILSISHGR
jgi:hypothetical protein